MSEDSTLVLVQPQDSIDEVAERVHQTGVKQAQLLIPADTATLRNRYAMADLRRQLAQDGISISVISSDDHVLQAARQGGIDTLRIEGTQVSGPLVAGQSRRKAAARPTANNMSFLMGLLSAGSGERLDRPSPRITRPIHTEAKPASDLAAEAATLQQLDSAQTTDRYAALSAEDAELYSSYDDLSDAIQSEAAKPRSEPRQRPAEDSSETSAATREGTRELERSRGSRATEDMRSSRRAVADEVAAERTASRRSRRRPIQLGESAAAPRRDMGFLVPLLLLLALLAALAFGAYWLFSSRAAVTIYPPEARVREEPITDEVIPYNANPGTDSGVIQAIPVQAETTYTVNGQVLNQVVSPTNRARGTITLLNTIGQAIGLPEGTEFIGRNAQGADVRFALDTPTTIPAATTSSSLTGSSTTYGQIQVAVTARSPGAASNVPENSVYRILIPGLQLLDCASSNPVCRNEALSGGSDEPQWIVTEGDVNRLLQEALTGLYNAGVQQLRSQTDNVNTVIDATTITPNDKTLGLPENYEPPIISPALGQPSDPVTHAFSMTVRTRFNALATPANNLVQKQLETVVQQHFAQRTPPMCAGAAGQQPRIEYSWDGNSLKINGAMICTPQAGFADSTRLRVREALRGKSREEAIAALQALQNEGLIGNFEIPSDVRSMPGFDIMLNVNFANGQ